MEPKALRVSDGAGQRGNQRGNQRRVFLFEPSPAIRPAAIARSPTPRTSVATALSFMLAPFTTFWMRFTFRHRSPSH